MVGHYTLITRNVKMLNFVYEHAPQFNEESSRMQRKFMVWRKRCYKIFVRNGLMPLLDNANDLTVPDELVMYMPSLPSGFL